jgi:hypothetical protein
MAKNEWTFEFASNEVLFEKPLPTCQVIPVLLVEENETTLTSSFTTSEVGFPKLKFLTAAPVPEVLLQYSLYG